MLTFSAGFSFDIGTVKWLLALVNADLSVATYYILIYWKSYGHLKLSNWVRRANLPKNPWIFELWKCAFIFKFAYFSDSNFGKLPG